MGKTVYIFDFEAIINYQPENSFKLLPADKKTENIICYTEFKALIAKLLEDQNNEVAVVTHSINIGRVKWVLNALGVPPNKIEAQGFSLESLRTVIPPDSPNFRKTWGEDAINNFDKELPEAYNRYLAKYSYSLAERFVDNKNLHIANIVVRLNKKDPHNPVNKIVFITRNKNHINDLQNLSILAEQLPTPYNSQLSKVEIVPLRTEIGSRDFIKKITKLTAATISSSYQSIQESLPIPDITTFIRTQATKLLKLFYNSTLKQINLEKEQAAATLQELKQAWRTAASSNNNTVTPPLALAGLLQIQTAIRTRIQITLYIIFGLTIVENDAEFLQQLLQAIQSEQFQSDFSTDLSQNIFMKYSHMEFTDGLLHLAVRNLNFYAIQLLLDQGNANVNATDSSGDTALHTICRMISAERSNYFMDYTNPTDRQIGAQRIEKCTGILRMLLEYNADPCAANESGRTPHAACGSNELLLLLEKTNDITAMTSPWMENSVNDRIYHIILENVFDKNIQPTSPPHRGPQGIYTQGLPSESQSFRPEKQRGLCKWHLRHRECRCFGLIP